MAEQPKTGGPPAPPLAPELKVFEKDVGTWDADVEVRPMPGAPLIPSRGLMVNRLIGGGRWLVSDFTNETSGFQGHGVYGYDPAKKKYTGVWVDNARTFLAVAEGTWDAATHTMTFDTEIALPDRRMRWRETTQSKDADTQVFRSLMPTPEGGEFEMMTVTYRRRR